MPGTEKVEEAESGSDSDDDKKSKHRDKSRGGKKKPLTEYEKKRQKIEECKTSLPVYPFKEQLLQAIEEHQVHISRTLSLK
jgi:HrpA-like RNA helicase